MVFLLYIGANVPVSSIRLIAEPIQTVWNGMLSMKSRDKVKQRAEMTCSIKPPLSILKKTMGCILMNPNVLVFSVKKRSETSSRIVIHTLRMNYETCNLWGILSLQIIFLKYKWRKTVVYSLILYFYIQKTGYFLSLRKLLINNAISTIIMDPVNTVVNK